MRAWTTPETHHAAALFKDHRHVVAIGGDARPAAGEGEAGVDDGAGEGVAAWCVFLFFGGVGFCFPFFFSIHPCPSLSPLHSPAMNMWWLVGSAAHAAHARACGRAAARQARVEARRLEAVATSPAAARRKALMVSSTSAASPVRNAATAAVAEGSGDAAAASDRRTSSTSSSATAATLAASLGSEGRRRGGRGAGEGAGAAGAAAVGVAGAVIVGRLAWSTGPATGAAPRGARRRWENGVLAGRCPTRGSGPHSPAAARHRPAIAARRMRSTPAARPQPAATLAAARGARLAAAAAACGRAAAFTAMQALPASAGVAAGTALEAGEPPPPAPPLARPLLSVAPM